MDITVLCLLGLPACMLYLGFNIADKFADVA
jgi:hypothetical protein